jgi:hypothetical protein
MINSNLTNFDYLALVDQIRQERMDRDQAYCFLRKQALIHIETNPIVEQIQKALMERQHNSSTPKIKGESQLSPEEEQLQGQLNTLKQSIIEKHLDIINKIFV